MRTLGYTLLLGIAAGAIFLLWPGLVTTPSQGIKPAVCPLESKTCPDGSTVGRTGPDCTFAECTTGSTATTTASTTVPAKTATVPEDVTLAVGETKRVHGLPVSLNTIEGDSRCPATVQCIQAGFVTAQLVVGLGKERQTGLVSSDQPAVRFGRESVLLVEVMPARSSTAEIAQGDYQLTFRFETVR